MTLLDWCRVNGTFGDRLVTEWAGNDTQGNSIDISSITHGSAKIVQWKCAECSNLWAVSVYNRTSHYSICPVCSRTNKGIKESITKNNKRESLFEWCTEHNRNDIIEQWIGYDINGNKVDIHNVTRGSHRKVLWKCKYNHIYNLSIIEKTLYYKKCPECYKVDYERSLEYWCNTNGIIGKQLKDQWVGLTENDKTIDIKQITYGSKVKVKWICSNKHMFTASINNRTKNNHSGCPVCSKVNKGNNISKSRLVKGVNDLYTWCTENEEYGQLIYYEWTGEDEAGNKLSIYETNSHSKYKVKWKCNNGHEWLYIINERTSRKRYCPICSRSGTSLSEQIINFSFKQLCNNTVSRSKIDGYEFDIIIPELNICIEYGAEYWHKNRVKRDKEKEHICKKNNINFIQIVDIGYNGSEQYTKNKIRVNIQRDLNKIATVISYICKEYNIDNSKLDFERAVEDARRYMHLG